MASKDKDVVSLPLSPWDAILKAAKDQLPSLDSDSSLSDCEEEEPFIFQRNQSVLIPDLSEELAEDPVGVESGAWIAVGRSSSPEPFLVPGRLDIEPRSGQKVKQKDLALQERRGPSWACQSCVKISPILVEAEEGPPWLEGNRRSLSNPKGSQSPPWTSQGEATFPLEGELKTEPSVTDKRRALRRERRKMIEKDILQKVTLTAHNPACGDQRQALESGPWSEASSKQSWEGCPVLSLQVGVSLLASLPSDQFPAAWPQSCHTVKARTSFSSRTLGPNPRSIGQQEAAAVNSMWGGWHGAHPQQELVATGRKANSNLL